MEALLFQLKKGQPPFSCTLKSTGQRGQLVDIGTMENYWGNDYTLLPNREWNQISQNDFAWYGRDTSRPRQITDIQHSITIMGGREVSRPYRVWFFAESERFLCFLFRCPPVFIH